MSAFQHVSFCPFEFQHVSISAFQLLPEQISAFQLFSVSAFARADFSFCLGNFSISECLSSVFSLPSSVFPLPSLRVVFLSHFCFLLSALSADSSFSAFQLFSLSAFAWAISAFAWAISAYQRPSARLLPKLGPLLFPLHPAEHFVVMAQRESLRSGDYATSGKTSFSRCDAPSPLRGRGEPKAKDPASSEWRL